MFPSCPCTSVAPPVRKVWFTRQLVYFQLREYHQIILAAFFPYLLTPQIARFASKHLSRASKHMRAASVVRYCPPSSTASASAPKNNTAPPTTRPFLLFLYLTCVNATTNDMFFLVFHVFPMFQSPGSSAKTLQSASKYPQTPAIAFSRSSLCFGVQIVSGGQR